MKTIHEIILINLNVHFELNKMNENDFKKDRSVPMNSVALISCSIIVYMLHVTRHGHSHAQHTRTHDSHGFPVEKSCA